MIGPYAFGRPLRLVAFPLENFGTGVRSRQTPGERPCQK